MWARLKRRILLQREYELQFLTAKLHIAYSNSKLALRHAHYLELAFISHTSIEFWH